MRLGKSLIGKPVFTINDGRQLGKVKDLYLDEDLTSVVGLYLGREGLLRPTPLFIESADIAVFGIDAVLARSTATVYEGDEVPEPSGWLRLDELQGREASTPGGTKIGKVGDVVLDEEANVTGFGLTHLSVKGPIAESEAVARTAVVDVGREDGVLKIELAQAEQETMEIDPESLFSEPASAETPQEELGTAQEPDY